jgi:hypothetical protein
MQYWLLNLATAPYLLFNQKLLVTPSLIVPMISVYEYSTDLYFYSEPFAVFYKSHHYAQYLDVEASKTPCLTLLVSKVQLCL